ncbi:hypothetical protein PF005_g15008 [Phytophthora fragariae]|uniref:EF-hand domain-containing protein n=1 Tax=Phytophthora fragariae TaxID=53985 RepID=A0A6A3EQS3_9STRA|nr:hypothetical protein PF003_g10670 [Phytophthora fragariae]KAE8933770.1 hypothetical protein PF009_g16230 [Phytophthora fragariae]KAE9001403.1 hypothetical protein PF011_g13760 [Phytophthora fragariae]KAE9101110.1 hypothetical protein PF007_g15274 [Phytophthora fragariae]KAE9101123.1 hypothetical protein PF010_g14554 [Phytophthora fragariae]
MDERVHPSTPRFARGYLHPQPRVAAPYTELNIFPALSTRWNGANQFTRRTPRGLATLPFAFTMPSEVEDAAAFTVTSAAGSASNFLDALRSRTLLDLSCMREFSLLRTKPMPERNLSRLSVSSAYNMHTEQLHLQHLARPPQSASKDDSSRRASPVKQEPSELRSRLAHAHRKILQTADSRAARASNNTSAAGPRPFIASPPPTKVSPRSRQQQQRAQRPRTEPTSTSAPLSVAEQHGFLQEQDLTALMSATGYSRAELFARWARFKALCSMAKNPRGVDKETLRHGIPQLSAEDQFFVDRAIDVLDKDGSGELDWPEFIAALSALEKGDASRRVDFLFHAYDLNGDGFIQRHEVRLFFLASLLVPHTPQALEVARHVVDKIFTALGREQHDSIRVEDAMNYLHEHPATDAYSLLGRTMVSSPPSTPLPSARRASTKANSLGENEIYSDEHKSPQE